MNAINVNKELKDVKDWTDARWLFGEDEGYSW